MPGNAERGAAMADAKEVLAGIAEYDAGVARFMCNESMYARFLGKFIEDQSYTKLIDAMDAGDAKAAFEAAHTLKGTAATLELTSVVQAVSPLVEHLRGGDMAAAHEGLPALESAYAQAIKALRLL